MLEYQDFCARLLRILPVCFPDFTTVSVSCSCRDAFRVPEYLNICDVPGGLPYRFALRNLYRQYENGCDIYALSCRIRESILEGFSLHESTGRFTSSYRDVKDNVIFQLSPRCEGHSPDMLLRPVLNVNIVYAVRTELSDGRILCMEITAAQCRKWGVAESELFQAALINTPRYSPLCFETLSDRSLSSVPGRIRLHIISNESGRYGAAALLYPETAGLVSDKLGDHYIFPVSVHEVLAAPTADFTGPTAARIFYRSLLKDIPASEVLSSEIFCCCDTCYTLP